MTPPDVAPYLSVIVTDIKINCGSMNRTECSRHNEYPNQGIQSDTTDSLQIDHLSSCLDWGQWNLQQTRR